MLRTIVLDHEASAVWCSGWWVNRKELLWFHPKDERVIYYSYNSGTSIWWRTTSWTYKWGNRVIISGKVLKMSFGLIGCKCSTMKNFVLWSPALKFRSILTTWKRTLCILVSGERCFPYKIGVELLCSHIYLWLDPNPLELAVADFMNLYTQLSPSTRWQSVFNV